MSDYLKILNSMCWSPSQEISTLFTEKAIKHGFSGVQDQAPPHRHHPHQVHGTTIVCADPQTTALGLDRESRIPADGIWTKTPGECVAVVTADCLPVLIATDDGTYVMAVHAGWRGLVAGILPLAVQTLIKQDPSIQQESLIACIGPAIGRDAFEVGPEVIAATAEKSFGLDTLATSLTIGKGVGDRWHFDLATAAALQFVAQGMLPTHIEIIKACTKTLTDEWHSYRREGKGCGVNRAWIEAK